MSRLTTMQKRSRSTASRAQKRAAHVQKRAGRAVAPAAADARDATIRYADATRDWTAPKVEAAVDWSVPKVESAMDWAAPRVESARDWAAPHVETAVDWAAPKVEPAVDKIKSDFLPVVTEAVASALAATEPARSEVATRGSAALAAIKGELDPPKQSRHRFRKLLLVGGVLAAAYAGWKAFTRRSNDPIDAWTTAPRPTPSPVGYLPEPGAPVSTTTIPTDDPAGAGPDEALADKSDEQAGGAPTTTTEAVTPAQASKVSAAAAKGASGSAKSGTGKPGPKGQPS